MLLAIDQGTTGTTCLVVDDELSVRGRGYDPVAISTPRPGWVEQDPEELWASVERAADAALADAGVEARALAGVGITNQRETTIVWERASGVAVQPAIVWQDRRTADRCRELPAGLLRRRTGLTPDPYFSATKLEWILRDRDPAGLAFGTVDTWLLWKLTGGAVHATDTTNASRTMLLDLARLGWDEELLDLFGVPQEVLPEIRASASIFGETSFLGPPLPVAGAAGDQQASLFGHGGAKATLGTGAFVLVETGSDCTAPPPGLVRTAAASTGSPRYALEGSVFVAGAAVQWLRDGLGVLADSTESEGLARSVDSTDGVVFVPALTGLGSPHWRPDARGRITGLGVGTTRAHLARATLEAIAFQVLDVVDAMPERPSVLRVDGGASANGFLTQFLADVLQLPVEVAAERETTALGAAGLAGVALGRWSADDLAALRRTAVRREPERSAADVELLVARWRDAVRSTLG